MAKEKPVEYTYNYLKKMVKQSEEDKDNSNFIAPAPFNPVMLDKDVLFEKVTKLIASIRQSPELAETIELIKEKLGVSDTDIIVKSNKRLVVKTDENRLEFLRKLTEALNGEHIDDPGKGSSVGYVQLENGIIILVKPKNLSNRGIHNEYVIANIINDLYQAIGQPLNIRFVDSRGKTFECFNVTSASHVGKVTKDRKKADIIIHGDVDYPVSLKTTNAEFWESSDTYMGPKAKEIIDELVETGELELIEIKPGIYKPSKAIVFKANEAEARDVIFGNDILPNGAVIINDFVDSKKIEYLDDGTVVIPVKYIITSLNDVPEEYEPWFIITHSSSRNSRVIGIRGIRVQAAYKKRAKPDKGNKIVYRN